ncbi:putative alpha/beta hydrolase [Pseudomassariella vexata]|uniref:Putative alpha/beta hydrolase n=1 Tax=Pseudomassariella vexata TaxID=1141098 RepID=A0A1Y2EKG6_9PEZI|nr:putative alpha/beta hydrolase [Pseudomassariella vexata]ORY71794.1 putative alpha/beta hydrolase [Pseudomassariella vexata]
MLGADQLSAARKSPFLHTLILAACLALYMLLRNVFRDIEHRPEEHTITRSKARVEAEQRQRLTGSPYLTDTFPGGRQFKTVYGTIQVFEWGPEDGEKVLIVHGLATPCISMGNMAKEFVSKGCRVMIFDLFGRGYSDAPNDLAYDARLYTTQILLVLSSSPLSWTGSSVFHIVGFSLGGSIAVAFAAYHTSMLRSMTLICPGGLIRMSHISCRSRFIYSSSLIPEWLRLMIVHRDLEPRYGSSSAEVPEESDEADIDFDNVVISADRPSVKIGDVIRWQLRGNPGFVPSYLSTIRSALVYRRHDRVWRVLADELARRRTAEAPPGLSGGRICLILAQRDITVVTNEFIEDSNGILGVEDVDMHIIKGGHEIAFSQGKEVAFIATESWKRQC